MSDSVTCDMCFHSFSVGDRPAGDEVTCPECGRSVQIAGRHTRPVSPPSGGAGPLVSNESEPTNKSVILWAVVGSAVTSLSIAGVTSYVVLQNIKVASHTTTRPATPAETPRPTTPAQTAITPTHEESPVKVAQPASQLQNNQQPHHQTVQMHPVYEVPVANSASQTRWFVTAARLRHDFGSDSSPFHRALRILAGDLPEIKASVDARKPRWHKVRVNSRGAFIDAVRFRSPLEQPADLTWVFTGSVNSANWSIVPVEGDTSAFANVNSRRRKADFKYYVNIKGLDPAVNSRVFFQQFKGGHILPGHDYVAWFSFANTAPTDYYISILLTPQGQVVEATDAESISGILGIEYSYPLFEPTPAGIADAFTFCKHIMDSERFVPRTYVAFGLALNSVAAGLPEVKLSDAESGVVWNKIEINQYGTHMNAMRVRCPLDEPADLVWAVAYSGDQYSTHWLMPTDMLRYKSFPHRGVVQKAQGEANGQMIKVSDVEIAGLDLPPDNCVRFRTVTRGIIDPKGEYIFWCDQRFHTSRGAPSELQLALTFIPASENRSLSNSDEIAQTLGIKLPLTTTPAAQPSSGDAP